MLKIDTKSQGAELTSIEFEGKEMLFQGEKVLDENGNAFWKRQAPILFPIVGQIKEGKTIIEENSYEMSQHGFARDMEFEEISKTQSKHEYILKYNEETLKKYPYKFELKVTYEVIENILNVTYQIKNIDNKEIYFGLGAHPAFKCDYSNGEYELFFTENEDRIEFFKLKDGLIDTEKAENILDNNRIHLKENTFENDAIIMKNIRSNKIILQNNKTNKKILVFDFAGFPYLAIWSKKGAPFVCIEPWQNTADRVDSNGIFKEKENINSLKPQDTFESNFSVKFFWDTWDSPKMSQKIWRKMSKNKQ